MAAAEATTLATGSSLLKISSKGKATKVRALPRRRASAGAAAGYPRRRERQACALRAALPADRYPPSAPPPYVQRHVFLTDDASYLKWLPSRKKLDDNFSEWRTR